MRAHQHQKKSYLLQKSDAIAHRQRSGAASSILDFRPQKEQEQQIIARLGQPDSTHVDPQHNTSPIQRTVLKQKNTLEKSSLKARDIADQHEVEKTIDTIAEGRGMEVKILGEASPVKLNEPVVILAHGSKSGNFAGQNAEGLAEILINQHQVKKGMSIVLEGCYTGHIPETGVKDSFIFKLGDYIDSTADPLTSQGLGEEQEGKVIPKVTTVAGNPGVLIGHKKKTWGIFKKDRASATDHSFYVQELEHLQTDIIKEFCEKIALFSNLSPAQAEDIHHTFNQTKGEHGLGKWAQSKYSLNKLNLLKMNRLFSSLAISKNIKNWSRFLEGLKRLDIGILKEYQPKANGVKLLFELKTQMLDLYEAYLENIKKTYDEEFIQKVLPHTDEFEHRKEDL